MFRVAVVLAPGAWSQNVHRFVTDHVGDMDVVLVRDDRSALEFDGSVVMVHESTPWLTPAFVAAARTRELTVVGVFDRTARGGRERLVRLGVEHMLEAAMSAPDMVELVGRLRPEDAGPSVDATFASLVAELEVPGLGGGQVTVVGGPPGAGAREVALGLATVWQSRRSSVLVMDANELSPGVGRRLGLPVHPHVLTALERVRAEGLDGIAAALAPPAAEQARLPFDVLVGLAMVRDWQRLVPAEVEQLVELAAQRWGRVVVCTSPVVEDLSRWVPRYGVSRHLLTVAEAVVGVCEASPRGVLRFCDWVAELDRPASGPMTVVLNKAPRSAFQTAELRDQLLEALGARVDGFETAPHDGRVTRAEWDGVLPRPGPFTKAVGRVAHLLDRVAAERELAQ